eukprot:Sdes_comp19502_c0_seq4m11021
MFLYTPSQIALAVLCSVCDCQWYLDQVILPQLNEEDKITAFCFILQAIKDFLAKNVNDNFKVDVSVVKQIDRKLKKCRNPEFNPESSVFKNLELEKREEKEKKRILKEKQRKEREKHDFEALLGGHSSSEASNQQETHSNETLVIRRSSRQKSNSRTSLE